jgi:hypothetical protein
MSATLPSTSSVRYVPSFQFVRAELDSVIRILAQSVFRVAQMVQYGASFHIPGPADAARASSPMKKSKSSVPRLPERWPPGPAPPVKNDGLLATAGLPEPEPPEPPAAALVAIAVGNTKEGESFPAKPGLE